MPGQQVPKPSDPVIIGRIARPVGVHGEIKVVTESHNPKRLLGLETVTIRVHDNYRRFHVLEVLQKGESSRILLSGINSPEIAALLSGGEIVVPSVDRPGLSVDEYYIDDLIGCMVFSENDMELGIIQEVMPQGHQDLWVINGQRGEILVPAVKEFILNVDLKQHRIVIKHLEGLWDED